MWISTKMLTIPTFNGRKSYHPDLQINKGQLDRIINAAYYQVIKKIDHITYTESYSSEKMLSYLKKGDYNLFNCHKANFEYSYLSYS